MSVPEILPQEYQLATLVEDNYIALKDKLTEIYDIFESFSWVNSSEFESPYFVAHFMRISRAFNCDTDDEAVLANAYSAVKEAFYFASRLGASLSGSFSRDFVSYYRCHPDELREKIITDAKSYLDTRPKVEQLIHHFSYDMTHDGLHRGTAELVAAVTVMQLEEGAREKYIEEQLGQFARELSRLPVTFHNSLQGDEDE